MGDYHEFEKFIEEKGIPDTPHHHLHPRYNILCYHFYKKWSSRFPCRSLELHIFYNYTLLLLRDWTLANESHFNNLL